MRLTAALAFLVTSTLSLASNAPAQQSSTSKAMQPVLRSPVAVQMLTNSITALGGSIAWEDTQFWLVDGVSTLNNEQRPEHWDVTPGGYRIECDDPSGTIITTVDQKGATRQSASGSSNIPSYVERARIIPFQIGKILQNELNDPAYSIELISEDSANHLMTVRTRSHHSAIDELVTPQVWHFDTVTKLPVRVSLHEYSPKTPAAFGWNTLAFTDYRQDGTLLIPFQWSSAVGSHIIETIQLTTVNQK